MRQTDRQTGLRTRWHAVSQTGGHKGNSRVFVAFKLQFNLIVFVFSCVHLIDYGTSLFRIKHLVIDQHRSHIKGGGSSLH